MSTRGASKAKARAKAKDKETAVIADHQGTIQESAPTSQREQARAGDPKNNVNYNCGEKSNPAWERAKGEEGGKANGKVDSLNGKGEGSLSWERNLASGRRRTSRRWEAGSVG